MKIHTRIRVALLAVSFWSPPSHSQEIEWEVNSEVTQADRQAIEKLTKEIGLDAGHISLVGILPCCGQILSVKARAVADGHHRTWFELRVCRKDWKPYQCSTKSRHSVGRWRASKADLDQYEAWSIQDGDWRVDVPVDAGLPYDDVAQVVLAIRRKELVNRLPSTLGPLTLNTTMPEVDPTEITRIKEVALGYEVWTGQAGGFLLRVRIVGNAVELYGYSTWIV